MPNLTAIRWKMHLQDAAFPLGMFVTLIALEVLWIPLGLPPMETCIAALQRLFAAYGLYALYLAAMLEGVFIVSLYFPGSMVIFSAILLSDKSFGSLSAILAVCWLAFMSAAFVNYAIGRYGLYRMFNWLGAQRMIAQAEGFILRFGKIAYAIASFHPNYVAILEVCSGIARQGLVSTLTCAGVGMAVSGPILVFGSAMVINGLMRGGGLDALFVVFVGLFGLWSLISLARGIRADLASPLSSPLTATEGA